MDTDKLQQLITIVHQLQEIVNHLARKESGKPALPKQPTIHDWIDKNPQAIMHTLDGTPGILIQYLSKEPVITDRGAVFLLRDV